MTAAERLALDMSPVTAGTVVAVAQRAIDAGWVHRDDLVAEGWTPPPDPHEAIARRDAIRAAPAATGVPMASGPTRASAGGANCGPRRPTVADFDLLDIEECARLDGDGATVAETLALVVEVRRLRAENTALAEEVDWLRVLLARALPHIDPNDGFGTDQLCGEIREALETDRD